MKHWLIFTTFISCVMVGCSRPEPREYFIRPCKFVCDYSFNDTTKWVLTCRVWGLLKYYHSNVTAGKLDWDKVLLNELEEMLYCTTPETVNLGLRKMLDIAGEYTYKEDKGWNDSLNMNVDLCWLDNSFLDETLQSELRKIASMRVKHPSYYGMGIDSAWNVMPRHEKMYDLDVTTSFKYRLLAFFRFWNVIYYYYPHKYLMDKPWDETLAEFIFPFIEAEDNQSYQVALLKLMAFLDDGHAYIYSPHIYSPYIYYPKVDRLVEFVEGKTVVKIDEGGLQKGDIVHSIGKIDVNHIRDSLAVLISASTQANKEYRINSYVGEMMFFNESEVAFSRNGQKLTLHMLPVTFEKEHSRSYKKISDDIGYADLSMLTTDDIDLMFHSFSDMKGLIFDLRKVGPYNYDVEQFECYLSSDSKIRTLLPTVFWDIEHPGAFIWRKHVQEIIPDNSQCPGFKGKLVFLIDECSQSSSEAKAWIAHTNLYATLIGRPTSGALGRIAWIPLPGKINATFSGFSLLSLDETELQRKGVIPDIEVYPTIESIKAGKDEILEAAIEYLNGVLI